MRWERFRSASAGCIGLLVAASGCASGGAPTAERDCAHAVIEDWSDGSLDAIYPDTCYLAALDALPEDLRAYSSAGDDIRRALLSRRPASARTSRTPSEPQTGQQGAPGK